jgi:peptide/nickel transport system permease protein
MIRSSAISVKDMDYVVMSTLMGGNKRWAMVKHVLPNIMPMILMAMAGSVGGTIMAEASMNFLGYGVSATTPDWGAMLTSAGRSNMYAAPWLALIPGIAIAVVVFASAMFSDGVRDLLDPRLKGGVGSYKVKKNKKNETKTEEETAEA